MLEINCKDTGYLELCYNHEKVADFGVGIDKRALRYQHCEVQGDKMIFCMGKNEISVEVARVDDNHLLLKGQFDFEQSPHSVELIHDMRAKVDGVFHQGFGMCGPSGYLE